MEQQRISDESEVTPLKAQQVRPVEENTSQKGEERAAPSVAESAPASPSRVYAGGTIDAQKLDALMYALQETEGSARPTTVMRELHPKDVLAALVHGVRRRKRLRRFAFIIYVIAVAAGSAAFLHAYTGDNKMLVVDLIAALGLSGLMVLSLMFTIYDVVAPPQTVRVDSRFAKIGYDRMVGELAEALKTTEPEVVRQAERELAQFLPRLSTQAAHSLTPDQRHCLYGAMMAGDVRAKSGFILACLRFVERTCDTLAIPEVIALAECDTRRGLYDEVKQAAKSCLALLNQSDSDREAQRSLLRASAADAESPDTLLRPVETSGNDDPNELLRAQREE